MVRSLTSSAAVAAAAASALLASSAHGEVYFKETFEDAGWRDRWVDSTWKGAEQGEWEWSAGDYFGDAEKDKGLRTKDKARFYGISTKLDKPFSNRDQDLVLQFSVKNENRATSFCGGGYIKLMGSDVDQANFGGDTPYKIMFGPDLCGYDVSRIHTIFNYKGENLLKNKDIKLEYGDKNEFTHLYTLHLRPDNTYTVYMDNKEKASGSLPDEWNFPSKTVDDPNDSKPDSWVDEPMMLDPEDVKPEGYDDIPAELADPDATKPEDWSDEDDGEWEAPMVPNPAYLGPWTQKKIPNPEYKGDWVPAQLPNPAYDETVYAFEDIGAVGFELWIVDNGSIFDNIFIGNDLAEAKAFAAETFDKTLEPEKAAKEVIDAAKKAEADAKRAAEGGDEDDAAGGDMPDLGDMDLGDMDLGDMGDMGEGDYAEPEEEDVKEL